MRFQIIIIIISNQPASCCRCEGWLLLRLEALFCSIHLLYEGLISILSKQGSGIYTESIRLNSEPYTTFEKCAVIIIDIEKIQKVKVNREDASFVDI